jgi:hypothetical protein
MGQFIAMMGAPAAGAVAAAPAFGSVAAIQAIAAPVATGGFLGLSAGAWQGISTAGSMLSSVRAGQAQKVNYEMQARDAEFAAKDREVQRRKRLVASLASQNAYRGASGVRAFEGSPAAMMKSDIKEFDYDQSMAAANLGMKQNSLLTSGKYAQQSGYISAGASLLTGASKYANRG